MHVDLAQGQWVELRDPRTVTERVRRPVKSAAYKVAQFAESEASVDAIEAWDDMRVLAAVALIDTWSVGHPVTVDSILDLPSDVYDGLLAAVEPHISVMMPVFSSAGVTDPKAVSGS
jgi:hypothetical protein